MRRDSDDNSWKKKVKSRQEYKSRQVDKFINWSIKQKGYLKYKDLIEFEKQYNDRL